MTVANHVAAIVAIVVGAYAVHLWWREIRDSLGLLAAQPLVEAIDLEFLQR
jgi:drug/metabolite transporter superfamily protein YnfA